MISLLFSIALSLSPLQSQEPPLPPPKPEEAKMVWFDKGLKDAIAKAGAEQKLVMLYFNDQRSGSERMNRESFAHEKIAAALKDMVCFKVDYDRQRAIADTYRVKEPPVIVWLNSDGSARERVNDYEPMGVLLANISRVKADIGTINESRRKIAANGNDLDARFDVYTRLKDLGDLKGSDEQRAAIEKLDPEKKSRGAHHFRYEAITSSIEQFWAQTHTLDMAKIAELRAFVEVETDPDILWDGWMRLANTHQFLETQASSSGQIEAAAQHRSDRRQCLSFAYRGLKPDLDGLHEWGYVYADLFWEQRAELSPADKDFYVRLTERLAKTFDLDGLAHDHHARALFVSGQRKQALEEERRAIELDASNSLFATHLKDFGDG
jgi:hypothetical protein